MCKIKKRNGDLVDFDISKIKNAITKAFKSCEIEVSEDVIKDVAKEVKVWNEINVEDIQNQIEEILMDYGFPEVAKEYIIYRYIRSVKRNNTTDKTVIELLNGTNEYWNKENANKRAYLSTTQHDYLAGISSTDIMKRLVLPKNIVKAHEEGIIHIHDLDYSVFPMLNCQLINLKDMLENGTVVNGYKIDPQKRFLTACTVATQIILGVSSFQYGGCTISTAHLAPFLRKSKEYYQKEYPEYWEKLYLKELTDGVQTFNYQVNSMSNSNGQ